MDYMLNNLPKFINEDLKNWNVSKVTTHSHFSDGWGVANKEPLWEQ
jgi:hypothetical protein